MPYNTEEFKHSQMYNLIFFFKNRILQAVIKTDYEQIFYFNKNKAAEKALYASIIVTIFC